MATSRRGRAKADSGPVSLEQIEREAVRLFSEKTYPVVGMRDISDAVGLLPGSLYVHIRSKEDLLLKIVERGVGSYLDALLPLAESTEPARDRLREAVLTYMHTLDATLAQTKVAVFQWRYLNEENRRQVAHLRQQYEDIFHKIVESGISSGEFTKPKNPKVTIFGLIGLLNSTMHWYSPEGGLSATEVGENLADLILDGLDAH